MKRKNIIKIIFSFVIIIFTFGLFNKTNITKAENNLTAGTYINIENIDGNLNDVNFNIEFVTPVNLDGNNNALLIALVANDNTLLTDIRFVCNVANNGIYDKDDVSIIFDNVPETIGTKTFKDYQYTYVINSKDFNIKNDTKKVNKLFIIGQKGEVISSNINFYENYNGYDPIVDAISVSDLSFDNLSDQSMISLNKNTDATFTFSNDNVNKNLIFKFKYDVKDTIVTDSNAVRIGLDVSYDNWNGKGQAAKWNTFNSLWLRGDGTYVSRYKNDTFDFAKYSALDIGIHDIEYGRIAIIENGKNNGNYYTYYKLDGNIICEYTNPYDKTQMDPTLFINFSSNNTKNKIYDCDMTYEDPLYVSINDLKYKNKEVGYIIKNTDVSYTYDTTNMPTYKSISFISNIDYKEAQGSQIYLTSSGNEWNQAGYIWFQKDRTYFGITDNNGIKEKNKEINYDTLATNVTYKIEYGRKAIFKNNNFTGKYHVYFKIDDNLVYAVDQKINDDVLNGGTIHFTGDGGFDYKDLYYDVRTSIDNINSYMNLGFSFEINKGNYENVKCVLGTGIDKNISNNIVDDNYIYGIEISTSTKKEHYDNINGNFDENENLYYKIINLGDIINNKERAYDIFTIRSYIEIDNVKYYSHNIKQYSVSSMIDYYINKNNDGTINLDDDQLNALNSLKEAIS